MLNNLLDQFDPDSPWYWLFWLYRGLLEVSKWARLAIMLRRRPAKARPHGEEGNKG
jgi:hypothetical protein